MPPPLEKCASSLFLSRLENDLRTCHLHDREHSRAGRPSEEDLNSQEVSPCGVHRKQKLRQLRRNQSQSLAKPNNRKFAYFDRPYKTRTCMQDHSRLPLSEQQTTSKKNLSISSTNQQWVLDYKLLERSRTFQKIIEYSKTFQTSLERFRPLQKGLEKTICRHKIKVRLSQVRTFWILQAVSECHLRRQACIMAIFIKIFCLKIIIISPTFLKSHFLAIFPNHISSQLARSPNIRVSMIQPEAST